VSPEESQDLAERGYGAWSREDLDGMLSVMAPDVVFHTSGAFVDFEVELPFVHVIRSRGDRVAEFYAYGNRDEALAAPDL
jgi:hypothetical protein